MNFPWAEAFGWHAHIIDDREAVSRENRRFGASWQICALPKLLRIQGLSGGAALLRVTDLTLGAPGGNAQQRITTSVQKPPPCKNPQR